MKLSSLFEKPKYPLSGRDIFIDKKNRLVFYRKRTKEGFVVAAGQENNFRTLRTRFVLGLCAFALLQILLVDNNLIPNPLFVSVPAGVIVAALMEWKWRKLLNNAPMIQNFDTETAKCTIDLPSDAPLSAIVLKIVLFIVLSILLIVNLYVTRDLADNISSVIITYAASVGALYFAFKHVKEYQKQKEANQKQAKRKK